MVEADESLLGEEAEASGGGTDRKRVLGTVEGEEEGPGRLSLRHIDSAPKEELQGNIETVVEAGSRVR